MKKIKVLQINAGSKNYGGVSSLLFNLYKNINRDKYEFNFLTPNYSTYGMVENEIKKLGGKVFELKCTGPWFIKKIRIWTKLNDFLTKEKYDIIHINSGSYFFNLMVAIICKKNNIENVIVHSHNGFNRKKPIKNFIIKRFLFLLNNYCSLKFSCSYVAAESMFEKKCIEKDDVHIIKNGIEIEKFKFNNKIRDEYREKFNVQDKIVIGNIGRFVEQKNHMFLLKIFDEILKKNNNSVLMLVGEGELEQKIKKEAKKMKIEDNILFLGKRKDVNNLLQCFDVLVMPSLYEGLPITAIEAQTCGLSIALSNTITNELKINENIVFLDLKDNPNNWANEILSLNRKKINRENTYKNVTNAGYTMEHSAKVVENLYDNLINKKGEI